MNPLQRRRQLGMREKRRKVERERVNLFISFCSIKFNLNRRNVLLPHGAHQYNKLGNWRIEGLEQISTLLFAPPTFLICFLDF
jgi:hypothetical protein